MQPRNPYLLQGLVLAGTIPFCTLMSRADDVLTWGYYSGTVPPGLSNVIAVAGGDRFNLALKRDGTVAQWGFYSSPPSGLSNVVVVAAGDYHSLALKSDGTVEAWIAPGLPSSPTIQIPRGLTNVVAISAGVGDIGRAVSFALKADGTVVTWGIQAMALPYVLTNVVAISAGGDGSALALRSDGTIVGWGNNYYGEANIPPGLKAVAIAAGGRHCLALRADGKVVAWGDNGWGQSTVPAGLSNVVSIAAGWGHSLALRDDGRVIAWGLNGSGETNVPSAATNVIAIAAGCSGSHSVALVGEGRAPFLTSQAVGRTIPIGTTTHFRAAASGSLPMSYQWRFEGTNLPTATNALLTLTNAQLSQAGEYSIVVSNAFGAVTSSPALLAAVPLLIADQPQALILWDGADGIFATAVQSGLPVTYQWRFNGTNLPGETNATLALTNLQAGQIGSYSATISNALGWVTTDGVPLTLGRIAAWGGNYNQQVDLPLAIRDAVAVIAGPDRSLVLRSDGTIIQWGNPEYAPPLPTGLSNVVSLAAGWSHTVALKADGSVVVWGGNNDGQTNLPPDLTNVIAIAAGGAHSLALRADGTVATWGNNDGEMLTVPADVSNVVAIAARETHSMVLTADGRVRIWGESDETNAAPVNLTNIVAIASGGFHSLALKSDGTVAAWGENYYGQTNVPGDLSNVVAIAAGSGFSMALKSDGTVVTWGNYYNAPVSVPAGVSNVVGIAAGDLYALALLDPMLPPRITDWRREGPRVSVSLPTLLRKQYALEFKDSLSSALWANVSTAPGNGGRKTLEDTNALAPQRFYRLRME